MKSKPSGPSRLELCKRSGCTCICHEPVSGLSPWTTVVIVVLAMAAIYVPIIAFAYFNQKYYAKHPPEPYYCTGITSTGSPADCHPAVFPPDVLQKYEDYFKK